MKYPFSQLIREIFVNIQGLRARVYKHTPSEHNAGDLKNFLTYGGVTLFNFIVAPLWRSFGYNLIVAPQNINKDIRLQLRKEGI